jgi:nicotinate-nucleotide adenylyltransferase
MNDLTGKQRIGLMGGSFDPVHAGHLIIAQDAAERLELSEVVFIPAAIPPHKQHLQQADIEHRLNMLNLAVESDIRFSISDIEMQRGGVSYTIETVKAFKELQPNADYVLIIGSDTLIDLHNWYNIDELLDLCDVATLLRPGMASTDTIAQQIQVTDRYKSALMANIIETHLIGISSTEIRMRVAEGLGIRYLVPPEVEMYIFEHGLYKG